MDFPDESFELPGCDDMHVHLRQGSIMKFILSHIEANASGIIDEGNTLENMTGNKTGIERVLVMPNLSPPITDGPSAYTYYRQLFTLNPSIQYKMTLYMTTEMTCEILHAASLYKDDSGERLITGVKVYPKGVTTASSNGILMNELDANILRVLQELDFILHVHGELPSTNSCTCDCATLSTSVASHAAIPEPCTDHTTSIMYDSERLFIPFLKGILEQFPRLKVVMEHITTEDAAAFIMSGPSNLACTLTVHHLYLTMDDVFGMPHHFCKPIAKSPSDRRALIELIRSGHPRVFLGSDSAPHPIQLKESTTKTQTIVQDKVPSPSANVFDLRPTVAAGIYTFPHILPLLMTLFEKENLSIKQFKSFVSENGAKFMNWKLRLASLHKYKLIRKPFTIPHVFQDEKNNICIVPFLAGKTLPWSLQVSSSF